MIKCPDAINRSVPPCVVIPVLIYPDPGAAADWLSKAFGFTVRLRIANHRVQMKAGDGCFTIAEGNAPNNSTWFRSASKMPRVTASERDRTVPSS